MPFLFSFLLLLRFFAAHFLCLYLFLYRFVLLLLPTIELTSMKIFTVLILLDMLLHTLNV